IKTARVHFILKFRGAIVDLSANGPAIAAVVPFAPPAIEDAQIDSAIRRSLHSTGSARLERTQRMVQPKIDIICVAPVVRLISPFAPIPICTSRFLPLCTRAVSAGSTAAGNGSLVRWICRALPLHGSQHHTITSPRLASTDRDCADVLIFWRRKRKSHRIFFADHSTRRLL